MKSFKYISFSPSLNKAVFKEEIRSVSGFLEKKNRTARIKNIYVSRSLKANKQPFFLSPISRNNNLRIDKPLFNRKNPEKLKPLAHKKSPKEKKEYNKEKLLLPVLSYKLGEPKGLSFY